MIKVHPVNSILVTAVHFSPSLNENLINHINDDTGTEEGANEHVSQPDAFV